MSFKKRKAAASFNNIQAGCGLHSHSSKLEAAVCQVLQSREKAGEIKLIQCQDHIYLTDAEIHYIPDFKCLDLKSNEDFWVEAKGYANERWPMKKKLWQYYGPGRLEIWMGSHMRPVLKEIVTPKERKK